MNAAVQVARVGLPAAFTVVAALSAIAGGCCSTTQQVKDAMQRLELKNRTREESTLRVEATRRGAELLPNLPEHVVVPPDCDKGPSPSDWMSQLQKQQGICGRSSEGVLRIFVKNQKTRLIIPVTEPFMGTYSRYTPRLGPWVLGHSVPERPSHAYAALWGERTDRSGI